MLHRLKVSVAVVEFVRLLMLSRTQPIKASGSESRLVSRSRSSTQAEISGMRGEQTWHWSIVLTNFRACRLS